MARLPVLLAMVALCWLPALGGGWVWDDHGLVLKNAVLTDPTWERVFGQDLWCCTDGERTPYYRPVMTLSLLLDRALGGAAWIAHAQSVGWHLACVALLFGLCAPAAGRERAAAVGLLVGLHPLGSEAVAWVAARNDLLAAAGVLGALYARQEGRPWLAGGSLLFALLSKESALLLAPLVAAWPPRVAGRAASPLAAAGAVAVWAALRARADLGVVALDPDPWSHPVNMARVVLHALGWGIVPWPLTSTASVYGHSGVVALGAGGAAVAGLVALGVRGGGRARAWLLVAVLGLAPALWGLRLYGQMGERYLYLPLLAVGAAVAASPLRLPRPAVGLLALAAAALLMVRLPDWRSNTTLFTAAARRAPDSYSLQLYASVLGDDPRARYETLEASLAAEPHSLHACRHVADAARKVLDADAFVARLPAWEAARCREATGFDGPVATQLLAWRRWPEARAWVASNRVDDPSGRLQTARTVLALEDGDLVLGAALTTLADDPVAARDRVATLRASR